MLLRNFDYDTKYFDYRSKTEFEEAANFQVNGWYKLINGLLCGLLVKDNNLYFLYGEKEFLITESHRVLLKGESNVEAEFNLTYGNDVLVRFLYPTPDSKLNVSPFEYIDEEDFDWGGSIAKIINDGERKSNFIMNLMGG